MSAPVFYITPEKFSALTEGGDYALAGREGHHAKVKRIQLGERVDIADGKGYRAVGEAAEILPDGVLVRIHRIDREQAEAQIHLVQALAKDNRDVLAIETATELGVSRIVPWSADRSIVRWKVERATKAHTKWCNTVAAAAKQSRRSTIPEVAPLHSSGELARLVSNTVAAGGAVFVLHERATASLSSLLTELLDGQRENIYLIIGPEGGITDRELELLSEAGARSALLGPHVLRSSTAGPAALCAVNLALGRW